MKARLTITDLTRMQAGRVCLAGYLSDRTCIRPVFPPGSHLMEDWLLARGQVIIRPFAIVEFDFHERRPQPPHTEDRIIDRVYRRQCGLVPPSERPAFLAQILDSDVAAIFGAPIHHERGYYVLAGEGRRSLGTIMPANIGAVIYRQRDTGDWLYRLTFADATGASYTLAVTDLAFRYYLDHLRLEKLLPPEDVAECILQALRAADTYLRIGLARHWERYPNFCFLQITGVHTFPDYLHGRCFADFAPLPGHGPRS